MQIIDKGVRDEVDDLVVNVLGDSKNSSVEKDSSSLVNQENNFEGKDGTQKK